MPGIETAAGFHINAAVPVDTRLVAADLTTTPSGNRYEGLTAYQSGTSSIGGPGTYQLFGGITDGDWQRVGAGQAKGQVTFQKVGTVPVFTSIERWTAIGDTVIDSVLAVICGTEPSGADLVVDLLLNDAQDSLWPTNPGNRPTVVEGTTTSSIATPDTTTLANLDYIVPSVVQVGSVTPGSDLIIQIQFHTT